MFGPLRRVFQFEMFDVGSVDGGYSPKSNVAGKIEGGLRACESGPWVNLGPFYQEDTLWLSFCKCVPYLDGIKVIVWAVFLSQSTHSTWGYFDSLSDKGNKRITRRHGTFKTQLSRGRNKQDLEEEQATRFFLACRLELA